MDLSLDAVKVSSVVLASRNLVEEERVAAREEHAVHFVKSRPASLTKQERMHGWSLFAGLALSLTTCRKRCDRTGRGSSVKRYAPKSVRRLMSSGVSSRLYRVATASGDAPFPPFLTCSSVPALS